MRAGVDQRGQSCRPYGLEASSPTTRSPGSATWRIPAGPREQLRARFHARIGESAHKLVISVPSKVRTCSLRMVPFPRMGSSGALRSVRARADMVCLARRITRARADRRSISSRNTLSAIRPHHVRPRHVQSTVGPGPLSRHLLSRPPTAQPGARNLRVEPPRGVVLETTWRPKAGIRRAPASCRRVAGPGTVAGVLKSTAVTRLTLSWISMRSTCLADSRAEIFSALCQVHAVEVERHTEAARGSWHALTS
jgi:hypothetical protein